eukprot:gene32541-39343_t
MVFRICKVLLAAILAFYNTSAYVWKLPAVKLALQLRNRLSTQLYFLPTPPETPIEQSADEIVIRDDLWKSRRKMASTLFAPLVARELSSTTNPSITTDVISDSANSSTLSANTLYAAFCAVALVLILRLGGRSALLQVLGLDLQSDQSLQRSVQDILLSFQEMLPATQLFAYFVLWLGCKLFCIDAFTIVLAISSGLLYGDVVQGTLVSVFCSSLASALIFLASRRWLRPKVAGQIESRPILRALDRACNRNGFKTVLGLRLSPLLPIPIGAYNYLYGVLSVSVVDFVGGITLGSIKPYLLDNYLGVFGRSMLPLGEASSAASPHSDVLALAAVALLVVAGGLAAELFQKTYREIQDEVQALGADKQGDWMALWGVQPADLPPWLLRAKTALDDSWARLERVLDDELSALRAGAASARPDAQDSREDQLERHRSTYEFERLSFTPQHFSEYLLDSLLFSIVVMDKWVKTATKKEQR